MITIVITDNRTIASIQDEFCNVYPWLKLEFFHKPKSEMEKRHPKLQIVPASSTVGECRTIHKSGILYIEPDMQVGYLENTFKAVYGLTVQVFRKSGKVWLQTTMTDGWTLHEQNARGREMSDP